MLKPRRLLAAAAEGGQIYTFGGCGSACFQPPFHTSTVEEMWVEVYNPAQNSWTEKRPIPAIRDGDDPTIVYGAAAAAVNGKIYLFGGYLTGNVTLEYYPAGDTWANKAPMPTARFGLAAVAVGGRIYVLGGSGPSNAVEIYDPATDTWRKGAPMPTARVFFGAAVVNGKIFAVGGSPDCCGQAVTNAVEVYDPVADSWAFAAPLPIAQQTSAVQAANGRVYVLGGFIPGLGARGTAYEYEPATNSWRTRASLLTPPRDQAPAVLVGGEIFLVGGSVDCHCQALDDNDGYTPEGLSVQKDDGRDFVCAGETTRYLVVVRNDGMAPVTGAELIDELKPPYDQLSLRWCSPSGACALKPAIGGFRDRIDLAAGAEARYDVEVDVPTGASAELVNEAHVRFVGEDVDRAFAEDRNAILRGGSLKVSVSAPDSVMQGDDLPVGVRIRRVGAVGRKVKLVLTTNAALTPKPKPPPPAGCSITPAGSVVCDVPLVGGMADLAFSFPVPECFCKKGPIVITASVSSSGACGEGSDSAAPSTNVVGGKADLAVVAEPPSLQLAPESGGAYRLTVSNGGPGCSCGATLRDSIPPDFKLVSVKPIPPETPFCEATDDSFECHLGQMKAAAPPQSFEVKLTAPKTCPLEEMTRARVEPHAFTPDPNGDNNKASVDLEVVCPIDCDLQITKTAEPSSVCPCDAVDYTITVENAGSCEAKGATVRDLCPAGLDDLRWCCDADGVPCVPTEDCPLELKIDLAPKTKRVCRVRGTASPLVLGTLPNTATVEPPEGFDDEDPTNDSATTEVTVAPCPCVNSYCVDISGTFFEGSAIVKTYVLLNGGPAFQADNPGDEFTDVLPATLTLVSAAATSGTAATAGNTVTWNGSIPVGGSVTITITATINLGTAGMTICNEGTVFADCDGNGVNETLRGSIPCSLPCCFIVFDPARIPTLSGWSLAALVLLLAALTLYRLRARSACPRA